MIHPLTSAQLLELLTSLASAGKAPVTSSLPAQIIEYDRMNSLQQDMVEEIWMQAEREGLEEDYPEFNKDMVVEAVCRKDFGQPGQYWLDVVKSMFLNSKLTKTGTSSDLMFATVP